MTSVELSDIQQYWWRARQPGPTRCEVLSFRTPAAGQRWLEGLVGKVGTAQSVGANSPDARWITIALTWNGLRALGLDEASFPSSFPGTSSRKGMATPVRRVLGLTGGNRVRTYGSANWRILRCTRSRFSSRAMRQSGIAAQRNMRVISSRTSGMLTFSPLDLAAIPPYDSAHEHFGYRDRPLSFPLH